MSAQTLGKQTFGTHLLELRSRLFTSFLSFIVGSIIGYLIHPTLIEILIEPWGQNVFYTSPAGGFDFVLKVSLLFGFLVSIPVFLYHTVRFVEPVLPARAIPRLFSVLFASIVLLVLGVGFSYFVSLPSALTFLSSFGGADIQALVSTDSYFSFAN